MHVKEKHSTYIFTEMTDHLSSQTVIELEDDLEESTVKLKDGKICTVCNKSSSKKQWFNENKLLFVTISGVFLGIIIGEIA